jgi:hypothetical protein
VGDNMGHSPTWCQSWHSAQQPFEAPSGWPLGRVSVGMLVPGLMMVCVFACSAAEVATYSEQHVCMPCMQTAGSPMLCFAEPHGASLLASNAQACDWVTVTVQGLTRTLNCVSQRMSSSLQSSSPL